MRGGRGSLAPRAGWVPAGPGRAHSPFLGALHHQLVVTGHELELGGPFAHALQALPHRGHGPAAPLSEPRLPLARGRWPRPGPHGSRLLAALPAPSVRRCLGLGPGPLSALPPVRLAETAGAAGRGASVPGAPSGERAVSWSRTPVGRRAGLRRARGGAAGLPGPFTETERGRAGLQRPLVALRGGVDALAGERAAAPRGASLPAPGPAGSGPVAPFHRRGNRGPGKGGDVLRVTVRVRARASRAHTGWREEPGPAWWLYLRPAPICPSVGSESQQQAGLGVQTPQVRDPQSAPLSLAPTC